MLYLADHQDLNFDFELGFFSPITRLQGRYVDAALAKAAKRLNATNTQILFCWARAKGVVIVT